MQETPQQPHHSSLSFGIERVGFVPLRWPLLTGIVVLLAIVAASFGMSRLQVDDSLSELFRADTPEFRAYETMSRRFPSSEFDVLVVIEGPRLLERDSVEALREFILDLQFVDGQIGIVSLFSAREPPEPGRIPAPLFPAELPEGADYDRLIAEVLDNRVIAGKLLSLDGELALVVIALDHDVTASVGLREVVGQIRQIAEETLGGTGLAVQLSGVPVMQLEIRNAVERDRMVYNAIGFALGALIAIAFFRRVSLMIIAALPPVIGILWSLGMFGFLGFRLNLFLNVMAPLIMAMGFSDTMQITYAMRERLLAGDTRREAIRWTVIVVVPACVLTTATTAASFLTLILFTDSSLIRTFGFAGALSTVSAYLAIALLCPLLGLLLLREDLAPARRSKGGDRAMDLLKSICGWIAERVAARPATFALGGAAAVIALGVVHMNLEPRYHLADQVPDREQAIAASNRLDAKLTGANPVHVMIDWPAGRDFYDPVVLDTVGEVHRIVEGQSGVGNVWSAETLREWLREAGETEPEVLKDYVEVLPEHLVARFVNFAERSAVVTGRIPDVDAAEIRPEIDRLDDLLAEVRRRHPDFQIAVTGLSAIAARNSGAMIGQLNLGLTVEMAFVSALIGLAFRSVVVAFVTVLPNLFPVFAAGALLAATGQGLQFASIVALTIAFGLAVDATIHYLNRLRREEMAGEDPAVGVKRATVLIGPALVLTTVVLAFGLGVTVFSDLPSLRLFGQIAAFTLMAALVGILLILPGSMLLARRVKERWRKRLAARRTA